jgi:hypothetical protein
MGRVAVTLLLATVANALGWALPVVGDYRGWQAFRVAFSPMWPFEEFHIPAGHLVYLSVASALTNALFVIVALLLLRDWPRARTRWLLWAAAAATLLNLHWPLSIQESRADLEIGYFVWVVSFLLLTLAAFFRVVPTPRAAS